jgi:hypothetical protein
MQEFTSISVSSYEADTLTALLNEKSGDGWNVVSIVPTGSTVTAYLARDKDEQTAGSMTPDTADAKPDTADVRPAAADTKPPRLLPRPLAQRRWPTTIPSRSSTPSPSGRPPATKARTSTSQPRARSTSRADGRPATPPPEPARPTP